MAANRVYVPFTLFKVRIYDMRHLWEPSREYKGKAQDKPNYMVGGLIPKTRAAWHEEPDLQPAVAAYMDLLQKSGMSTQQILADGWPIKDGDVSIDPTKQPADWMRGHWMLRGNSQNPIAVSTVQNGNVVPLMNRAAVKPGDYAALALSAGVNQQSGRAVKHYCNTVLFMAPGEEIAVGNGASAAELMQQAQKQGLQVTGFGTAPMGGGFPGTGVGAGPSGGFGGGAGTSFAPQALGVPAGAPQPGFPQAGSAPMGLSAQPGAPAPINTGAGFPSNGGPRFPGQ